MKRGQIDMFAAGQEEASFESARSQCHFDMLMDRYADLKEAKGKPGHGGAVAKALLRDVLVTMLLEPCDTYANVRQKLDFILGDGKIINDLSGPDMRIFMASMVGVSGAPNLDVIVTGEYMERLHSTRRARDVVALPCHTVGDVIAKALFLLRNEPDFLLDNGCYDNALMRELLASFLHVKEA